ncbi:DegT/DnrJ/EryC1/StrS family aminotransferase [Desulfofustis glycolicus]|uniref:dTDP-4-amino-4,6-dideoxygalactose transaminase n=1 Tax=Desulfofustis glycolicus DSM 9705 TaxID=1121409 RepID=A0A1M5VPV2_9BACT|nr:DegT/DnrJ/EryC1/StrS aminotransferase family protein [Desulfofustis glycolicus]SHH77286.1 dTDP-4-amino-4,6-dideoxygalactose transaminase [Desulfofustis glycolicus DSM 9705]
MLNIPFPPWPSFTAEEANSVVSILLSNCVNYWTGDEGKMFEKEYAVWGGVAYAIALANGTVALEAALAAIGIGKGDEVVVTPRSFLASVSCVINAGGVPIFADVDRDSQNITAATIRKVLSPKTRAVVCVHLAGWPCDMDSIMDLAAKHNLAVIEDCAQAHGARYKGRSVGSFSQVGAWSFCQDKIMTTGGEGGMVTTNDRELWSKMWSLKDHGKSWDAVHERQHPPGFRWLHESFGTNWRMTEMQAAIGRIQLGRMEEWHQIRLTNAEAIWSGCREIPGLRVPVVPEHIEHAAYKCYVFSEPQSLKSGWSRDRVMEEIVARGVPCFSGSCSEVYLEKAFDNTGWRPKQWLPVARELGETSLMFLVHPGIGEEEVGRTVEAVKAVMAVAVR